MVLNIPKLNSSIYAVHEICFFLLIYERMLLLAFECIKLSFEKSMSTHKI